MPGRARDTDRRIYTAMKMAQRRDRRARSQNVSRRCLQLTAGEMSDLAQTYTVDEHVRLAVAQVDESVTSVRVRRVTSRDVCRRLIHHAPAVLGVPVKINSLKD